jgi:hypothetical protein
MEPFTGTQRIYVEENEVLVACVEAVARPDLQGTWVKLETTPLADAVSVGEVLCACGYAVLQSAKAFDEETHNHFLADLYAYTRTGPLAESETDPSDIPF